MATTKPVAQVYAETAAKLEAVIEAGSVFMPLEWCGNEVTYSKEKKLGFDLYDVRAKSVIDAANLCPGIAKLLLKDLEKNKWILNCTHLLNTPEYFRILEIAKACGIEDCSE